MKNRVHILISKFLKGESTNEEKNILEVFEKQKLKKNIDNIFSSKKEKQSIEDEIFANITAKTINKNNWRWLQIAASIAILFGIGIGYYNMSSNVKTFEVCNNTSSTKNIHLLDGSEIVLNSGSSIKYTEYFNDEDRLLELKGEAFFNVARDENKPFIITTGKLKTQVLGTSFNICKTDSLISVTVSTGLVQVYDEHNVIRIRPNQEAIYSTGAKDLNKRNIKSKLVTSWFKEDVELSNVSMKELAELMQKRFNTKLSFNDANLANKRLTITISEKDSISTIINRINQINEVKLTKTQTNIIEVQKK